MSGWVKFENCTPDNLKVADITDRAHRLWFNAICYASRARSDGLVPTSLILTVSRTATPKAVAELVAAGLLEPVPGGYRVHDYLDYNPSRERVEFLRENTRNRVAKHRQGEPENTEQTDSGNAFVTRYPHARNRSVSSVVVVSPLLENDNGSGRASKREPTKRADPDSPPASFPDQLRPALDEVVRVLGAVQSERGGNVPTIRGVGLAMVRYPDRDHLRVARELEHWALAGTGQNRDVRDWARTFATFLGGSPPSAPSRPAAGKAAPVIAGGWQRPDYDAAVGL